MTYYDAIASGYNKLHGQEQRDKITFIKTLLTFPKEATLLDVGCGTGISTALWECTQRIGIDPAAELIKIAKKDFADCRFHVGPAEKLPFYDKAFDIVVSLTAIQNFDDLNKGLLEIQRVGKGIFVLSYLKKSPKADTIKGLMTQFWPEMEFFEEQKDVIGIMR